MKFKKIIAFVLSFVLIFTCSAYGHSGRTDSSGGHRDNSNASGLGYYHYHCDGHPAHLHYGGVCPYSSSDSYYDSYSAPSKSTYSSSAAGAVVAPLPKVQLKKPKIHTDGHKSFIEIYWEDVNHASKYSIYRSTSKNGTYTKIATVTDTCYKDRNVTNEKVYYYKVKAFGSGRYTTSYYSNISSNYRFKGSITLDEEYVELQDGEKCIVYVTAKGSGRKIKAVSASDNISVSLSGPDKQGVYTATISAENKTTEEIGGHVNFYFSDRKTNTVQTLDVDVLPSPGSALQKITPGCDHLTLKPGEVTWFSLFTENVDAVGGKIDDDLITGIITDTEVEGAAADVIVSVSEDVSPGPEGILTWIEFFDTDDESTILLSFPVFIVKEK